MPRVAPSEKDPDNAALEMRIWDADIRQSANFPREAILRSLTEAKDNQRLGELIDIIAA